MTAINLVHRINATDEMPVESMAPWRNCEADSWRQNESHKKKWRLIRWWKHHFRVLKQRWNQTSTRGHRSLFENKYTKYGYGAGGTGPNCWWSWNEQWHWDENRTSTFTGRLYLLLLQFSDPSVHVEVKRRYHVGKVRNMFTIKVKWTTRNQP